MGFRRETFAQFNGFFVVIGVASPGDERTFHSTQRIPVSKVVSRALYCDDFIFTPSNVVAPAGLMSQEYKEDRLPGTHTMAPVAQDRDSYYLNAYRNGWNGDLSSGEPVEVHKVTLKAGESYTVQHNQAVMLGIGSVEVRRALTTRPAKAPAIIDARLGGVTVTALTDVVMAEVWI